MTEQQLRALMADMSLEEKVGQTVQIPAGMLVDGATITGPTGEIPMTDVERGLVGSILGKWGVEELRRIQDEQMAKQPHHIPMLFMHDVINGMRTIFPIGLGLGATFDPSLMEACAAAAAKEAAAEGLHLTFSPMVDLARDARWGRVMETTGEDTYLNCRMAEAQVKGYRGQNIKDPGQVACCVKHYAAYGAPEGGRDYDNVELSERSLREDYLPSYRAAVDAGADMVMTSFNTLDRIPSAGNQWLLRDILRGEMGFEGVVISDYSAVEEMTVHGYAEDNADAAYKSITAGLDIDMVSSCYLRHLADLVRNGQISERLLDESVYRILKLKNDLGLFENPYKDSGMESPAFSEAHMALARKAAVDSMVLLKNDGVLPIKNPTAIKIALIGPYADSRMLHGAWSFPLEDDPVATVLTGVSRYAEVTCVPGCPMLDNGTKNKYEKSYDVSPEALEQMMAEAVIAAIDADLVILALGEENQMSGEGASRTSITLPDAQIRLANNIAAVNDNIVTVLFGGRPLVFPEVEDVSKAVLFAWMPGTEGGNAIADILFGEAEPGGRLPMSFPVNVGQVPIYYNRFVTGRPNPESKQIAFINGYIDSPNAPKYPFGHGLNYGRFVYGPLQLSSDTMTADETITASINLKNVGDRKSTETVQLYLRDVSGSVVRPIRMLKGFEKVTLEPGESRVVSFEIKEEMLRFYDIRLNYVSEPGAFEVFVGKNSGAANSSRFVLK